MEALYLLVPLSVALVFLAIRIFFGMSDSGQFDDMVGPALRILQDDDRTVPVADNPPAEPAPERLS
jgi:cbb3-type cytochrome oxidase maturation protein